MSRDDVFPKHILDAIDRIERDTTVGQEQFFAESHWQDGVIRQLEIIGEATKRVSPDLRKRHPEVAWRRMAGVRDVLHNYMGDDLDSVWGATQVAVPDLKHNVAAILEAGG